MLKFSLPTTIRLDPIKPEDDSETYPSPFGSNTDLPNTDDAGSKINPFV